MRLRYLGDRGLSLRGPQTGRVYVFARRDSTADVDPSDVEALLRMRLFVRD